MYEREDAGEGEEGVGFVNRGSQSTGWMDWELKGLGSLSGLRRELTGRFV